MENNALSHHAPTEEGKGGSIGIFDSGYGGLTILHAIRQLLPQYNYIYLADNARTPYGTRSYNVVYHFTLQAVRKLFALNCPLIILACNTASAKALRTIQQRDLPTLAPDRRVLGIIRPTVEALPQLTHNQHIGILATPGTVHSQSYPIEIHKFLPQARVTQEPCPMWVPLVENDEHNSPGADYFIQQHLQHLLAQDPDIDTILLACTHYPLLLPKIRQHTPPGIQLIPQGNYVAHSLADYLQRHTDIRQQLAQHATIQYLTTEDPEKFQQSAAIFLHQPQLPTPRHITL